VGGAWKHEVRNAPDNSFRLEIKISQESGTNMHRQLRTVGFSQYHSKIEVKALLDQLQERFLGDAVVTLKKSGDILWEIRAELGDGMGILMSGFIMSDGQPVREHYQPFCDADQMTSDSYCSIQRHVDLELFSGMLEDVRVGIPLIFRVSNAGEYLLRRQHNLSTEIRGARLTGLSRDGKILLPIQKSRQQREQTEQQDQAREQLIEAARRGDEYAMETLNSEDISIYSAITKRMVHEDIYSIVDSSFMPQGLECDLYTVIGEIQSIDTRKNALTGEEVWDFGILTNDLPLHVIINKIDLQGDPQIGRRFKGTVWLQGRVVWERAIRKRTPEDGPDGKDQNKE